ncbi:flavin reductase domain protein FMN-binding [Beutenbergia cavernae DSM 12333]|uniref:Flavin reductase domain protein FMN-binding n=1 Tax=Beutenbergia cavernae (strain ATCC BAA-8 / DSM 12333 / CCUG 43141 / JCM 11478 / NBRC 16432 / NCIMB 13614 / HKI 0122) TaxID=471853 RepID=C5BZG0_BEUC1|nr:flavin reductase family protein [Beutenbergia cavernae]ACQ79132.1 flavin reductase domain protein FMN-binding [Beutenbergia cavernae DSM 12333]
MRDREPGFTPSSALYRPPDHFFRGGLARFATGVAVVTVDAPAKRHGLTVNSFTSVSMDPPLVLVSLQRTVAAHELLRGRPFTVNVLGAEQADLAMHFAGKPCAEPRWIEGERAPRLAGVLSWFECTPWAEHPAGDHTLFLGEVQEFDYRSGDALGFVNGQFTTVTEYVPGHESLL